MTIFFGFALADSMFDTDCVIKRKVLYPEEAQALIAKGVSSCCNPSHKATINAMKTKYGINVSIPETPPRVKLEPGDSVIVMGALGLPRLTDRHEYTEEEIENSTFRFSIYTVE